MDTLWIILGLLCILAGLAGSILPVLPGPPVAFVGLMLQLFREPDPFTTKFLWIWAGIVVLSVILDLVIPLWGTRRFGGSRYGVWGTSIGFLLAFWMGPVGIIAGPFLGAFVGELVGGQSTRSSLRAATGSFIGFLLGSLMKIILCLLMGYYLIRSI